MNKTLVSSVNYLKRENLISFIGSRVLVDHIPPARYEKWVNSFVDRLSKTDRPLAYCEFPLFKKYSKSSGIEHRAMLAPSPRTMIVEAALLNEVAKDTPEIWPDSVYSYRFTGPNSGNIFQNPVQSYLIRNDRITHFCANNPNAAVYFFDVKSYYPSIDLTILDNILEDELKKFNLSSKTFELAIYVTAEMLKNSASSGIPIGPAWSHFLGQLYLTKVDKHLSDKFGNGYFRFVDDIVIVSTSDQEDVRKNVIDILDSINLVINEQKSYYMPAMDWMSNIHINTSDLIFSELIHYLTLYFQLRSDEFIEIEKRFHQAGISIPLREIKANSQYSRTMQYIVGMLRKFSKPNLLSGALKNGPSVFVDYALNLRESIFKELGNIQSRFEQARGYRRKTAISRVRYLVNRLIYLTPPSEIASVLDSLPAAEELFETRRVLEFLAWGKADSLMDFYGRSARAIGQLVHGGTPIVGTLDIDWSSVKGSEVSDLIYANMMDFSVYGVIDEPTLKELGFWGQFEKKQQWQSVADFALRREIKQRVFDDFSFYDEIAALGTGGRNQSIDSILETRFSDMEAIEIHGLKLGGHYYDR